MIKYRGYIYKAAVEVARDALDDQAEFLVSMWLGQHDAKPGTPEYAKLERKYIDRAVEMGKPSSQQDAGQRVNQ